MNTYELECPKNCGDEIVFSYENDSDESGALVSIDFPHDNDRNCACEFTPAEKEKMTDDVIGYIAEAEANREPSY